MIVTIYLISGYYGPAFWEQKIWTFTHLEHVPLFARLPNLPLNESFLVFGAVGLGFNIVYSYLNVLKATRAAKTSSLRPLLLLLPFLVSAALQVAWLSHPRYNNSYIIGSAAFVPFLCAWGLQFAHMVGRMILAHVTKGPFPMWDWVWLWSVAGALDANLPAFGMCVVAFAPSFLWCSSFY
jgi:ethanolaminephosphotransferase